MEPVRDLLVPCSVRDLQAAVAGPDAGALGAQCPARRSPSPWARRPGARRGRPAPKPLQRRALTPRPPPPQPPPFSAGASARKIAQAGGVSGRTGRALRPLRSGLLRVVGGRGSHAGAGAPAEPFGMAGEKERRAGAGRAGTAARSRDCGRAPDGGLTPCGPGGPVRPAFPGISDLPSGPGGPARDSKRVRWAVPDEGLTGKDSGTALLAWIERKSKKRLKSWDWFEQQTCFSARSLWAAHLRNFGHSLLYLRSATIKQAEIEMGYTYQHHSPVRFDQTARLYPILVSASTFWPVIEQINLGRAILEPFLGVHASLYGLFLFPGSYLQVLFSKSFLLQAALSRAVFLIVDIQGSFQVRYYPQEHPIHSQDRQLSRSFGASRNHQSVLHISRRPRLRTQGRLKLGSFEEVAATVLQLRKQKCTRQFHLHAHYFRCYILCRQTSSRLV